MYGLPTECREEERPGRLWRALIDVSQNLFQHHFEVYFENPLLKVSGEREARVVCCSTTLHQLVAAACVLQGSVLEKPKLLVKHSVDTSTPDDIYTILIYVWSSLVQKKHIFNSVGFHPTSVIPTSGIVVPLSLSRCHRHGKLLFAQLHKPLSLTHPASHSLACPLLSDQINCIPSTSTPTVIRL